MNEIQPRLFLGDLGDAQSFDGDIICVTEVFPENEPIEAVWIPLLKNGVAYPKQLDLIAWTIGRCLINNKVLVHCVPPDTIILGDNKPICEYKIGDKVLSHDGALHSVSNMIKHDHDGDLYEIDIKGLLPIKCTSEHMFLVYRPYIEPSGRATKPAWVKMKNCNQLKKYNKTQPIWIRADQLRPQDVLLSPMWNKSEPIPITLPPNTHKNNKKLTQNIKPNSDLSWLLGLYIADGIAGKYTINITLGINDDVDRCINAFEQFGVKATSKHYGTYIRVIVNSSILAKTFRDWFGTNSHIKKIPEFLFSWDRQSLIDGLVEGDGCITRNNTTRSIMTTSKILSYQIWQILVSLGEYPYMRTFKRSSGFDNDHEAYIVEWASNVKQHYTYWWNGYYCLPIKKINVTPYNGIVYDVEIEDSHSFVGDGVINHNCFAGIENSPLAMTWFLYKSTGVSLNGAFNYIKEKRRGVQNRIHWIKNFRDYLD